MAIKKPMIIGDCTGLPFTSRRNRFIDGGAPIREVPEAEDTGFRLQSLVGRPILEWPPVLPSFDPRGHRNASEFEAWKKAQDSSRGVAGNHYSIKGNGRIPCLSTVEKQHLSCFELNPYVIEIRMQYPEWDSVKFQQYKAGKRRFPKNGIMTIDFMLTLKIPGDSCLRYHAVSSKEAVDLETPSVIRRNKREANAVQRWNATHELLADTGYSKLEYSNNERILQFMKKVDFHSSFSTISRDTATFAVALNSSVAVGCVDRVIGMVAKRLGWDLNTGYRLFAVGIFLGYISWDHKFLLSTKSEFKILR